jgi:uncharacterized oxidoreductase
MELRNNTVLITGGTSGFGLEFAKRLMSLGKLIDTVIAGLQKNKPEIYPGLSRVLNFMSRLAPGFLLNQTSKIGAKLMEA